MKENDVITITLKGKDAKKYFLERTTEKLGIRFQEIPKDSLILEEIGSSKMAVEIFKDALEMNFLAAPTLVFRSFVSILGDRRTSLTSIVRCFFFASFSFLAISYRYFP